jgi:dienelactone hydrolase
VRLPYPEFSRRRSWERSETSADQNIPAEDVAAFDRALDGADVPHELTAYPGAPHSFFDRALGPVAT